MMEEVFIRKCTQNLERDLSSLAHEIFTREAVQGKTIFLKPNWVNASPSETGVTTDIRVVRFLARSLKNMGAKRIIAGDGSIDNTSDVFQKLGVLELEKEGIEIVNLDECETLPIKTPFHFVFETVRVPKCVMESDIVVSIPKIKTHETTLVTLSIKNFYGFLSKSQKRAGHISDIHLAILDIYSAIEKHKTCHAVVDGMVGLEGRKGPIIGAPVNLGLLIGARSLLACDIICSKIMSQPPRKITHLDKLMKMRSLDPDEISVMGEELQKVAKKFEMPPRVFNVKLGILVFLVDLFFKKTAYLANERKCVACQNCIRVCPMQCISLGERITFDYTHCINCLCCVEGCGYDALDYKIRNEWFYRLLKR